MIVFSQLHPKKSYPKGSRLNYYPRGILLQCATSNTLRCQIGRCHFAERCISSYIKDSQSLFYLLINIS